MLDTQFLRKNLEEAQNLLNKRGFCLNIEHLHLLENTRRKLQIQTEDIQSKRNAISREIGIRKLKGDSIHDLLEEVSALGLEIEKSRLELESVLNNQQKVFANIPNLPHHSVPSGRSEYDNIVIKKIGKVPKFDFRIKDHVELGEKLGISFERGAKLSGARFCVLSGQMARLQRGLANFMLDTHTKKHGYLETSTPLIVNPEILFGTGQLPKFSDDMFLVNRGGGGQTTQQQYLISTSEITLTNLFRQEILDIKSLPILLTAHTQCFRSEAGSYGKDTRGLIRQHQFEKVELVHIVEPEKSYNALEELLSHAEFILNALELPYRVVSLCAGDLGFSSAKTYDLEVWLPAQNCYREISSCSNMEAFQARRMQTRFRDNYGKIDYPHTLNGSGLAIGRTIAAILENFQNLDGSIRVPNILRSYLGCDTILAS